MLFRKIRWRLRLKNSKPPFFIKQNEKEILKLAKGDRDIEIMEITY